MISQDEGIRAGPSPIWWVSLEGGDWDRDAFSQGECVDAASTSQDKQSPRSQERGLEHLPPQSLPCWHLTLDFQSPGPWDASSYCPATTWWFSVGYGSLRNQGCCLFARSFSVRGSLSEEGKRQMGGAHTFAAGDGGAPDHVPILQDAGDGLRAMRFDKSIITVERDWAPQQEPVTKTPPIYGDARIVALVLTKCWKEKKKKLE